MNLHLILLLGLIVFLALGLEGITGFGGTVLALPFLTMLLPVSQAVNIVPLMSVCWGLFVIARNHRLIQSRQLGFILLFAAIGIPAGIFGLSVLPEKTLKIILGVFVTFAAIKGFYKQRQGGKSEKNDASKPKKLLTALVLLVGGVFQGAFASGGPLFVIYASREIKDKSAFRVTLSCVWVICNTGIFIRNLIVGGIYTADFFRLWLCIAPFFLAGAVIGNALHRKVSVRAFTLMTNIILLLAGISALVGVLL